MVQRGMTWKIGSGVESNVQMPAAWQGIWMMLHEWWHSGGCGRDIDHQIEEPASQHFPRPSSRLLASTIEKHTKPLNLCAHSFKQIPLALLANLR